MIDKDLVVIINGAGTNGMELKALYQNLVKNNEYFVYYPGLLPGSFVGEYFPKSTTRDFIRFIDQTIEMIEEGWRNVYLIGYSLGASTASIISARCEHIDKLILIAPIVKNPNYNKFLRGLTKSLRHSEQLTRVQKIFYGEFIRRFKRVPKIHIWHLQFYLFYTRKFIRQINTPTLIIETLQDEMVKTKSIDWIESSIKHPIIRRHPVDSSHFLFFDRKVRNEVSEVIKQFLKEDLNENI